MGFRHESLGENMSNCTLKACFTPEMSFINKLPSGSRIKLETKYSYNVKYSKELTCKGELTANVYDKDEPEKFLIKAVTIGVFTYKEGADKDLLHIETFKALFPYQRALISTITANAGIPAVILPDVDMEGRNIYRIGNL